VNKLKYPSKLTVFVLIAVAGCEFAADLLIRDV
jgi:hypothetical protein